MALLLKAINDALAAGMRPAPPTSLVIDGEVVLFSQTPAMDTLIEWFQPNGDGAPIRFSATIPSSAFDLMTHASLLEMNYGKGLGLCRLDPKLLRPHLVGGVRDVGTKLFRLHYWTIPLHRDGEPEASPPIVYTKEHSIHTPPPGAPR